MLAPPNAERPAPPDERGNGPRKKDHAWRLISPLNRDERPAPQYVATLHPPQRADGVRYSGKWSVSFRGELVVESSTDPECDCARVLLTRGFTGTVAMLDEKTLRPRSFVDIRKAALHRTAEGRTYPKFRGVRAAERAPAAERHESDRRAARPEQNRVAP